MAAVTSFSQQLWNVSLSGNKRGQYHSTAVPFRMPSQGFNPIFWWGVGKIIYVEPRPLGGMGSMFP